MFVSKNKSSAARVFQIFSVDETSYISGELSARIAAWRKKQQTRKRAGYEQPIKELNTSQAIMMKAPQVQTVSEPRPKVSFKFRIFSYSRLCNRPTEEEETRARETRGACKSAIDDMLASLKSQAICFNRIIRPSFFSVLQNTFHCSRRYPPFLYNNTSRLPRFIAIISSS